MSATAEGKRHGSGKSAGGESQDLIGDSEWFVRELVPRWRCGCRLPLVRRQKAGSLSRRNMTSGMPNSDEETYSPQARGPFN